MLRRFLFVFALALAGLPGAQGDPVRSLTHPGASDPFWPDGNSPKFTTPQWVGEDGVEAVVILAIDDMRENSVPKYEAYLRPILEELKRDGGRAPLSIMTCTVKPDDPQLQAWLKEGVSIEVHTLKHPCPLLQIPALPPEVAGAGVIRSSAGGNAQLPSPAPPALAAPTPLELARATVDGCLDLLWQIPNNRPVAFRTPCCDSMSSPSPRMFSEILGRPTPQGHSLAIDSSVMCLLTPNDRALPRELVVDPDGRERFRKYLPASVQDFPAPAPRNDPPRSNEPAPPSSPRRLLANLGTFVEDYPYPYVINGRLWEFPCMVPSDWEAFNLQGPGHPRTVSDWEAALDAVVLKKGVFTFIFHPHGWIGPEQIAGFIRHARAKYGRRVKFLNFREAAEKLGREILEKQDFAARSRERTLEHELPPGVALLDSRGRDNGVRFVDLNGDGHDDIVFSNAERYGVYLFNPIEKKNVDWRVGWTFVMREGKAGDANSIPQIARADGTNNGVWFKHGAMWVQNEETSALPDKVRRIPFAELAKQPGPPPRTPAESLGAIHVKKGFKVELVAHEPLVQDPVYIDWDARGRMWVVEMGDYPFHDNSGKLCAGRVKILEDTDHDGVYDKASLFLDGLQYPTGLAPWKNGVFIASVPDVFFVEEQDGKPGRRSPVLGGFTLGNPQHLVNGFCWGLDGWYYGGNGDSGGKVVEARSGTISDLSGRDYRFNPKTGDFQLQAGKTQYGRWRDDFGNWFGCNNSSMGWHYFLEERYLVRNPKLAVPALRRFLNTEPDNKRIFPVSAPIRRLNWPDAVNTLTSGCNAMPYRDTLFGEEYGKSFFICEPANSLVHREVLETDGISLRSHRAADEKDFDFLASEDNFSRFTMARTGPDGCLYVVDMYRLVIEHPEWIPKAMQAHMELRAGEDKGRIYRVSPAGAKRRETPDLASMSDAKLVESLKSSNGFVRDTAQRLLLERGTQGQPVTRALQKLATSAVAARTRIQALHTLGALGRLDPESVLSAIKDDDAAVKITGLRLAEPMIDQDRAVFDAVAGAAASTDLRVQYQAVLSLGESSDHRAAPVLARAAEQSRWNKDILLALLTAAPRHPVELGAAAVDWERRFRTAQKEESKAPVQIVTNTNPDRDKVVRQYVPAVSALKGDAATGHTLFKNVCAACHKLKNEGTEIGPDLGTVAGKPTEQIVEAIMDPSRAVEMRYLAQSVKLKDGRELVAMIPEETVNSLTLRTATGTEVVLKENVFSKTATTKSVMPDGLETLLTPQFVADIIAWLREK